MMVYLWYPSETHTEDGVYLPDANAIATAPGADHLRQSPYWQAVLAGAVSSHAGAGGRLPSGSGRFPVVLFSHGDTAATTFSYTMLIEDLVSRGYIVAAVDHPGSSAVVRFPSGQILFGGERPRLRGDRQASLPYFEGLELAMGDMRQLADIEAADLRFVIDQLQRIDRNRDSQFFARLDLTRLAAVGHSLGGMAAVRACQLDARLKTCANLDGATDDGVYLRYTDARPLRQPFLFVEATPPPTFSDQELRDRGITRAEWTSRATANAAMQEAQLEGDAAGAYRVRLHAPGLTHMSFGDAVVGAPTSEAQQRALHNTRLTTDIIRAFLDRTLKGYGATLIDDTSERHPEWTLDRHLGVSR
jgi:pimeloyl-ACP methyl ester carboxylesterase